RQALLVARPAAGRRTPDAARALRGPSLISRRAGRRGPAARRRSTRCERERPWRRYPYAPEGHLGVFLRPVPRFSHMVLRHAAAVVDKGPEPGTASRQIRTALIAAAVFTEA